MMPSQSQMVRRLAIAQNGDEAHATMLLNEEGLGFARRGLAPSGAELYSWWNPLTANYWPQRHKLPTLDHVGHQTISQKLNGEYWNARNALESGGKGNYPIDAPMMGWAHPWGVPYGGMTGGSEIWLYDGLRVAETASNKGYKLAQMSHRMYMTRSPNALYSKWGEPTHPDDWAYPAGTGLTAVNMEFFMKLLKGPDPFGFNQAPTFQANHVAGAGLKPWYENALLGYGPPDFQHYIRITRNPKTLAWLGNDAMAKDELKHFAHIFQMSYHGYPKPNGNNSAGSGLLQAKNFTTGVPNKAFAFGRGQGWGLDTNLAYYAVADDTWRKNNKPWFNQVADNVLNGQASCSGFIQGNKNSKWVGGQFRARSSVEQAIVENALWGLKETVFRDADIARFNQTEYVLKESTKAMIGPMAWSTNHNAPWFYLAVTPLDLTQAPFCGSVPPGGAGNGPDKYQNWSSFAYGYQLTNDPMFLQRAAEQQGGGNLLTGLQASGLTNLGNKAALLATMQ